MPFLFRPVAMTALLVLAACGQPAAPAAARVEADEAATFNTDDDSDGINDVRNGHAEMGDEPAANDADDHDHDHDTAGGAPHVHGLAELAITLENGEISARMISPLANFGLSEAEGVLTDTVIASLPGLVTLTGGDCRPATPRAAIDTSSGHADAAVDFTWTCRAPAAITAVRFDAFAAYPGFETISTVFLTDTAQRAGELTPSKPELSLK